MHSEEFPFLQGYSAEVLAQVAHLQGEQGGLATFLVKRHGAVAHGSRTDKALYAYVTELRAQAMRNAPAIDRVRYDSKLRIVQHALGLHTAYSRVQGGRLRASREIRIATLFRDAPEDFLRMIVVHELAHLREREHGRAFYQLCEHMEPRYHQLELDVRLYLTHLAGPGGRLWGAASADSVERVPDIAVS
jgi:predicted metal-dependent hydrolase